LGVKRWALSVPARQSGHPERSEGSHIAFTSLLQIPHCVRDDGERSEDEDEDDDEGIAVRSDNHPENPVNPVARPRGRDLRTRTRTRSRRAGEFVYVHGYVYGRRSGALSLIGS
jgi:hypothetical protein